MLVGSAERNSTLDANLITYLARSVGISPDELHQRYVTLLVEAHDRLEWSVH